jgi:hypothetical protein
MLWVVLIVEGLMSGGRKALKQMHRAGRIQAQKE